MEHTLGDWCLDVRQTLELNVVLILVLMEHTLGETK